MSHCPHHLAVSFSRSSPSLLFLYPNLNSSPLFIEDLEHSYIKNHITYFYRPIPRPTLYFFYLCRLVFPPHLGQVRLVSGFFRPGKQSASNFIDGGMGGKPNGEFFFVSLVYIIFRGFFSHSHHFIVHKPYFVNKNHIPPLGFK